MPARPLALALAALAVASARADEPKFKKHDINPKSICEAAGAFDIDNDGDIDILSGGTWYEAPDWTPHKVRDVTQTGTYLNSFSNMPMDVDGDGDTDIIDVSYFGQNVGWVENPGDKNKEWTYHEIDKPGSSEAAVLEDLDGDGKPDVLPNTVNTVVWYSLDAAGPEPKWTKHQLPQDTNAHGHGVGTGDINRDGRLDLLTPYGWFEAPESPRSADWTWHKAWDLGATGIQILGRDVDDDGDTDLVYGMGHNYGLFWVEQAKDADGKPTWTKHPIDESIASVHTLLWADLDGDGHKDELVTGKRVYAHEVEAGDTDASVVAYYRYDSDGRVWDKNVLFQGKPAMDAPPPGGPRDAQKDFPPGTAGTGLEMTAIDIDKDGDIDLVCPGKSGLYLFENLSK
jgi:hypothetical protein